MGGNGSGKTTALKILAGIYKAKSGKIKRKKDLRAVYLTQNPQTVFTEIMFMMNLEKFLQVIRISLRMNIQNIRIMVGKIHKSMSVLLIQR